ncbi:MAG: transcriptional repressor, partial [Tenericutes bacterium]|nr:transcriptional repressor [Mycoplasmatota bacterium]
MERNTLQKKLILDIICNSKDHPTAEMVYNEIHIDYPNISKATVYRNLKNMASKGQIKKMEISGDFDRYDCNDSHYHAKCINCGEIFDVDVCYQNKLDKEVLKDHDVY